MIIQFTRYDPKARLPEPLSDNRQVYELYCAHTLFFENEERILFSTGVGPFIPEGFLGIIVPHPRFRFVDLCRSEGLVIEPGNDSLIELTFAHIRDNVTDIPPEGSPVALMYIKQGVQFKAEWSKAQRRKETINLN